MLKHVLCSVPLIAVLSISPALACGDGAPTAWFQPTTVQRGDSFLVTGTNVRENWALMFHFLNGSTGNWKHYTMQRNANSNCVENQEYIDTSDFKKATWFVSATEYNSFGDSQGAIMSWNRLDVVDRTSPAPVLSAYPCGQTAHAWFGPSVVDRNSNMFVAAVALPNRYVDFYFVSQSGGIGLLPGGLARTPIRIGPAHSNCVVDDLQFRAGGALQPGTYDVYAGFFDEYNRYHYDFLGTLTIT
jgi:hypothetical protein